MAYVGIDLGTTNSAIASYDGKSVHLYKSPEQHDVTPSVIFMNRRSKYVGYRAYVNAAASPDNVARLFKRFMGTSSPIRFAAVDVTMTPEEASAEVLRTLVGYLPADVRTDDDTGYVITVPAAFNQMQRSATLDAATMSSIGNVALMQEPVAAVMSVMQVDSSDGIFIVYDIGGGTLDVAIAEAIGGRVSLLAHGGEEMLGGREFDRKLLDAVVVPWLYNNFNLPPDWRSRDQYKRLHGMATWATERAKIELSQRETAVVNLSEEEVQIRDLDGQDVYIECPIDRGELTRLIEPKVDESIEHARRAIADAGLTPDAIERIVFVGGPTHYQPLRDKVAFELGIKASTYVNPMTAVATGAAIFAEAIDWTDQARNRKSSRGSVQSTSELTFNFTARTPAEHATVMALMLGDGPVGAEIQFDSLSTGWSSGRMTLLNRNTYQLPLPSLGAHTFRVSLHGPSGDAISLASDRIEIVRTSASVEAIPASHSILVEARSRMGGPVVGVPLVIAGEHLPKRGKEAFRAETAVYSGGEDPVIRFKLWEGEVRDRVTENRYIGTFEICGTDLVEGHIPVGAELYCHYEVLDSGEIRLEVEIPVTSARIKSREKGINFYTRLDAQVDYSDASSTKQALEQHRDIEAELKSLESQVSDHRLDRAREKLESVAELAYAPVDPEVVKQSMDSVKAAQRYLAEIRQEYRWQLLKRELENAERYFEERCREQAQPTEQAAFDNLVRTTRRAIESGHHESQSYIDELWSQIRTILWRQDWWVQTTFESWIVRPDWFVDSESFAQLKAEGQSAIARQDYSQLRSVVYEMSRLLRPLDTDADAEATANIIMA